MHPEDWSYEPLGRVAQIVTGGTPSRNVPEFWNGDIPWMSSGEINQRIVLNVAERITSSGLAGSNARVLAAETVMIALNGQGRTRGKVALLKIEAACNQSLAGITPDRSRAIPEYVFQYLESQYRAIREITGDDARNGLNLAILKSIRIPLPPIDEQDRIVEVLRSSDEALALGREIIGKVVALRAALLKRHFHRADWDPERPLPSGWTTTLLDEVAKRGSGHTPNKKVADYWGGDVAWVSLQDTKRLDKIYIRETAERITALGLANSSAVIHPAGTVVLSRDATVGRSAITASEMAVSQHFIAYACGRRLDNGYLYYWLQRMKSVFETIGAGSTIKTIGLPFFKGLKIAFPPLSEQREIAREMMSVDDLISKQRSILDRTRRIKEAVASDLFSGSVRVAK